MRKIDLTPTQIVLVVLALAGISLACGIGGLTPKPTTPPLKFEPSLAPSLVPEATSLPEATPTREKVSPAETATADSGVTTSGTQDEMLNKMVQDKVLTGSNADNVLKKDLLKGLVENTYKEGCIYSFKKVSITKAPTGSKIGWTEEWQMGICGRDATLQIVFTPTADGGTDFAVTEKK